MDRLDFRTPSNGPMWPSGAPALEAPASTAGSAPRWSPARVRAALATSVAVLIGLGVMWLGMPNRTIRWVHARPIYKWTAEAIELSPPPPPWIRVGASGLTQDAARSLARFEGQSALDLDLSAAHRAFKNQVWVERVNRIQRHYPNRLEVSLQYRRPVAFVEFAVSRPVPTDPDPSRRVIFVVDGNGVLLPSNSAIDLTTLPELVRVIGLGPPTDSHPGSIWNERVAQPIPASFNPEARPLAAAALAAFLVRKYEEEGWPTTPRGLAWPIAAINLKDQPANRLHIRARDGTWVLWGEAPGQESPGSPSAEEKWRLLQQWVADPNPRPSPESGVLSLQGNPAIARWLPRLSDTSSQSLIR